MVDTLDCFAPCSVRSYGTSDTFAYHCETHGRNFLECRKENPWESLCVIDPGDFYRGEMCHTHDRKLELCRLAAPCFVYHVGPVRQLWCGTHRCPWSKCGERLDARGPLHPEGLDQVPPQGPTCQSAWYLIDDGGGWLCPTHGQYGWQCARDESYAGGYAEPGIAVKLQAEGAPGVLRYLLERTSKESVELRKERDLARETIIALAKKFNSEAEAAKAAQEALKEENARLRRQYNAIYEAVVVGVREQCAQIVDAAEHEQFLEDGELRKASPTFLGCLAAKIRQGAPPPVSGGQR